MELIEVYMNLNVGDAVVVQAVLDHELDEFVAHTMMTSNNPGVEIDATYFNLALRRSFGYEPQMAVIIRIDDRDDMCRYEVDGLPGIRSKLGSTSWLPTCCVTEVNVVSKPKLRNVGGF